MRKCWQSAGVAIAVAMMVLATGCGAGRERYTATISYVLEPAQQPPEGLETVAILDSGAQVQGDEDAQRARKWSTIAADMIQQRLQESASQFGSGLVIADRRQTQKILAEQDLKAAGLVDADTAAQAGKLLDVQALVTSKLNINIDVTRSTRTTRDIDFGALAMSMAGRSSGPVMREREAEAIARHMTVQCSFRMIDAATSESYVEYAPPPIKRREEKEPEDMFGHSYDEMDLDDVDRYIGELVEEGVREFVSSFVPIEVEYSYEVESSHDEASAAGVAMMRAEDYEGAINRFETALLEDPDDHRTMFCLGVAKELSGDYDAALKYYRQACGTRGVDDEELAKYMHARKRLSDDMDRIRK